MVQRINMYRLLLLTFLCLQSSQAELPYSLPSKDEISKIRSADLVLSSGTMRFELFPEDAPRHVANFKYLADKGFYRGLKFHLVYPDIIVQAGAPNPKEPNSGPGYSLEPEFSQRKHIRGTLGMARLPNEANSERASHGSQFHLLLTPNPRMDSQYTIFGQCIFNCDLLDEIHKGDSIIDLKVYVKSDH